MIIKHVIYNGVLVAEGWPAEIEEAQKQTVHVIDGIEYVRVRHGEEGTHLYADRPCHDCAVILGQVHVPGCDMERCPLCGGQWISCRCERGDRGEWGLLNDEA